MADGDLSLYGILILLLFRPHFLSHIKYTVNKFSHIRFAIWFIQSVLYHNGYLIKSAFVKQRISPWFVLLFSVCPIVLDHCLGSAVTFRHSDWPLSRVSVYMKARKPAHCCKQLGVTWISLPRSHSGSSYQIIMTTLAYPSAKTWRCSASVCWLNCKARNDDGLTV